MEGEGTEEGQTEGIVEGEGPEEGQIEGILEGQPEGIVEGEGAEEGQPEGVVEGEGDEEGGEEGVVEGEAEGEGEVEAPFATSPANGETLSFGLVVVKMTETGTYGIENLTQETLVVETKLEKGGLIVLEGDPQFSLAAGQFVERTVRFTPGRGGNYNDRILITAGDYQAAINIHGQGVYVPVMSCHGETAPSGSGLWQDMGVLLLLGIVLVVWSRIGREST